jgi:hypothetical protein
MQYAFGSGVLFGRSTSSNTPTPVRFGALQDVSIDISFSTKELHGQYQFPLALGRGNGKITGKADFAQFNAHAFNDLFFGLSAPATGSVRTVVAEAQTISGTTANAAFGATGNFSDLGVARASDGAVYARVTSGPTGLQYTVSNVGAYAFNSSQNAVPVLLSYQYADASNGKLITITNQLLGNSPQFSAAFTSTFNGKSLTLTLNACMSSKLSMASKLEDFMIPKFDFSAYADAAGVVGTFALDE